MWTYFSENRKYEILKKILRVGVLLVPVDGETCGHDEAHSRFSHANSLKRARGAECSRWCVAIYAV